MDMQIVDENSEYLGIPGTLLMENAGAGFSRIIESLLKNNEKNNIMIFAGTGNNGGDGFVAARHLAANKSNKVRVFLAGSPNRIRSNEAKVNWNIINNLDSITKYLIRDSTDIKKYNKLFEKNDIIIDALLGTGISGKLREPIASIIKHINSLSSTVISVDVPSGMDPETGKISDDCIIADMTITFHKAKNGLNDGDKNIGKLKVVKIGIPSEAEYVVGTGDLRYIAQKRAEKSHKGDFGKVLIIGGSDRYSGAPAISALAAYRTGSDLVIIAAPKSIANALRNYSPNIIIREYNNDFLTPKNIPEFQDLFDWSDSIIIGPGLGKNSETFEAITQIFKKIEDIPTVIDADAIKALADNKELIKGKPYVITPHLGEFKIFTGNQIEIPDDNMERAELIREIAEKYDTTILLKGSVDIIANKYRYKLNKTGTPAMTVGGTGDCLAGILGSLLGRKFALFRSATAAAFLCGKIGELAEKKAHGPHIMATDLLKYISFKNFL
ncbi:MAG: NAD(P)H-hydrate dehydratase [Promethearchaeota archaeon]|nr:MAG: NAD(P)H-hydrate dehydratase [Candidatus Lokiarchaeota archaeon]